MLSMSTLYDRLLEICRDNGIERPIGRDIQLIAGLSSGRVTQIKQEREAARLGGETLQRLTSLGYSSNWLQEGRLPKKPAGHEVSDRLVLSSAADGGAAPEPTEPGAEFTAVRRVRLKVSAGVTGFHVEPLNGDGLPIFFRADWLKSRHLRADRLLAVRVNGDSMSPGLYDGDLVVINTESTEPKDGEVFVINYEGEAVIKRLKRDGGQWWLSSDNPDKVRYGDKRCDEHAIVIGQVIYKQSEHI